MKEFAYSETFESLTFGFCLEKLEEHFFAGPLSTCVVSSKARESLSFATDWPQTSPPQSSTSPSKKATSLPLRLAKTGGSPGGRRPLTLAFCWGLECVWEQNTHFTSKKGLLGTKKLSRALCLFLLLLVGLESR